MTTKEGQETIQKLQSIFNRLQGCSITVDECDKIIEMMEDYKHCVLYPASFYDRARKENDR